MRILVLVSLLFISILSTSGDFSRGFGQAGGKDLVPMEISYDRPLPVRIGDIVEVRTTIRNQGEQAVGHPLDPPIKVKFIYVGADVKTRSRSGPFGLVTTKRTLRAGEEVTLTARLDTLAPQRYLRDEHPELFIPEEVQPLIPGTYNIYVQVDPDGEISGEASANNTISTPTAGPDLVVLEGPTEPDLVLKAISFSRGPIIGPEEMFLISASVYNGGTDDAGTSEIDFSKRRKGESTIEKLGTMETGELPRSTAQEAFAKTLPTIFSGWDPGVYIIQAWVDYRNEVAELDEGNNLQSNTLFIIDTARLRWSYPSFPIPLEDKAEEKVGAIGAAPAVAQVNGTTVIYFGSDDGYLYAIDSFGRLLWRYQTGGAVKTAPVIAQGAIYFGSDDGHLYAIDSNGDLEWKYPTGGPVKAAPAVYLGNDGEVSAIYFGSDDGYLYALNPDGSPRWESPFPTGAFIRTTPAVTTVIEGGVKRRMIYFGSGDGNLYALEDQGNKALLRWTFPTGSFIKSSPIILGQTIYFGSSDGHFYALFLDGTKKWEYPQQGAIGAVESAPLVVEEDGRKAIYFGSNEGILYKLEEDEDGEMSEGWQFNEYEGRSLGPIRCTPVHQGEMIYFGSDDGTLYALEDRGRSASDKWTFPTRGAITGSPAISGNTLYLPSWEGHLYALGLGG